MEEVFCKSALHRVREGRGLAWSVSPYRGCAHGCAYCYARGMYECLGYSDPSSFHRLILAKRNVARVLREELARGRWKGGEVALGTATDPYQPAEGKLRLTRGVLEALAEYRASLRVSPGARAIAFPVSLTTKSPLVVRDADLLRELGATVHLSLSSLDPNFRRHFEPGAPPPQARLRALRELRRRGVEAGVFLAPVLPFVTDRERDLEELAAACAWAGAAFVVPILLHLRPGVREGFLPRLAHRYPRLAVPYLRLYRRAYLAPDRARRIEERILSVLDRHGLAVEPPSRDFRPPAGREGEGFLGAGPQLSLWEGSGLGDRLSATG